MKVKLPNRNFYTPAVLALSALVLCGAAQAATIVEDGFEAGNLATSQNGFKWSDSTKTSVKAGVAKTGKYSLQFYYPANQSLAEQRIDLGGNYKDIWVSYDILIPANYYHTAGSTSPNNKGFLYLWSGDYSNPTGPGVGPNFWPMGDGSSKASIYNWGKGLDIHYGNGTCENGVIKLSDRGKWIKIVAHYKYASSANNDGIAQIWKIYDDGTVEQACNLTKGAWYVAGAPGFNTGYILGWANAVYNQDTYFYLDNFKASTDSLLTNATQSPPMPPTVSASVTPPN